MAKNPDAPPNSDIDGVHEDRRHQTDSANAAGHDGEDLKKAKEETKARPPRSGA